MTFKEVMGLNHFYIKTIMKIFNVCSSYLELIIILHTPKIFLCTKLKYIWSYSNTKKYICIYIIYHYHPMTVTLIVSTVQFVSHPKNWWSIFLSVFEWLTKVWLRVLYVVRDSFQVLFPLSASQSP